MFVYVSNNINSATNDVQTRWKSLRLSGISGVGEWRILVLFVIEYDWTVTTSVAIDWAAWRTSVHSLSTSRSLVRLCWKVPAFFFLFQMWASVSKIRNHRKLLASFNCHQPTLNRCGELSSTSHLIRKERVYDVMFYSEPEDGDHATYLPDRWPIAK